MKSICHCSLPHTLLVISLFFVLSCGVSQANENQETLPALEQIQQKIQKVGDYYQQVNNKLNNRGAAKSDKSDNNYIQPNSRRDPFAYTEQMYRNQQKQQPQQQSSNSLASNALLLATSTAFTADGLPVMKYRGYAQSPLGETIGILEILGMGVYTVRVGDKIGLHDIAKELVLVVEGLNRNNIVVHTGKLGKKLVIQ